MNSSQVRERHFETMSAYPRIQPAGKQLEVFVHRILKGTGLRHRTISCSQSSASETVAMRLPRKISWRVAAGGKNPDAFATKFFRETGCGAGGR
ncbi:hypothetical protein [Shinella sp. M31]|uniref:hypothetical protein n=1 Tax=Shinella sp. M31 TaxID=3368615 RepID=UPI003B9F2F7A